MGQRQTVLIVEDDALQRDLICTLLEEYDMTVIQCESGEAAVLVLNKVGGLLAMMFTDVNLAGTMSGAELAAIAKKRFPELNVIVTSGADAPKLPDGATFMPKPWRALDILREAEFSLRH